jgi:ribonucleoside-triphosphate reductase
MNSVLNELVIVKRSGQRVPFNGTKIALAIKNAFDATSDDYNEKDINLVYGNVLNQIEINYQDRKTINVEDIQDLIEKELKNSKYIDVYESFSTYRMKRASSREAFSIKQQHKFVKAIEKLILAVETKESDRPMSVLNLFGKTVSSEFAKSYLIDNKYVKAHEEGLIYIHELDSYALMVSSSVNVDIANIEFKSSYFSTLANILLGLKEEVSNEILVDNFDIVINDYALYKYKEILIDSVKCYFELNGILPYINIRKLEELIRKEKNINIDLNNYDSYLLTDDIKNVFNKCMVISKEKLNKYLTKHIKELFDTLNDSGVGINDSNYTIILKEENEITKIVYKILEDNDNYKNVSVGSKKIIKGKNTFKTESSSFKDGSMITGNLYHEQEPTGRMIVASTSLNMARLGFIHKKYDKEFKEELVTMLDLVKGQLLQTFEGISNKHKESYKYLFSNRLIKEDEKLDGGGKIRKVIKNGTLNINLVGISECSKLINVSEEELLKFINKYINEYIKDTRLNFRLSNINYEDIRKKLLSIDKAIYGEVKGITDKTAYLGVNSPYYKGGFSA